MPAYVVAHNVVNNPEAFGPYVERVGAVTASHGGRYLFVGPGVSVLEGDWAPDGMAIIEFPSEEAARGWYDSPEYQELVALRQPAGPMSMAVTPDVD
jgi:uncharacterized protein (DUF1330 family)